MITSKTATSTTSSKRFEFILYRNETKFIIQRAFDIRNFNDESLNSHELKELLDEITGVNNGMWGSLGIIPNYLKEKSVDALWNSYNPYYQQYSIYKNPNDKVDNFQFEINVDKKTICKSQFSGNLFQPIVRYGVKMEVVDGVEVVKYDLNVRELVPIIINEINEFMSRKNYTVYDVKPTAYELHYNEV